MYITVLCIVSFIQYSAMYCIIYTIQWTQYSLYTMPPYPPGWRCVHRCLQYSIEMHSTDMLLYSTALHCNAMNCTELLYDALQRTALHRTSLDLTALHCILPGQGDGIIQSPATHSLLLTPHWVTCLLLIFILCVLLLLLVFSFSYSAGQRLRNPKLC